MSLHSAQTLPGRTPPSVLVPLSRSASPVSFPSRNNNKNARLEYFSRSASRSSSDVEQNMLSMTDATTSTDDGPTTDENETPPHSPSLVFPKSVTYPFIPALIVQMASESGEGDIIRPPSRRSTVSSILDQDEEEAGYDGEKETAADKRKITSRPASSLSLTENNLRGNGANDNRGECGNSIDTQALNLKRSVSLARLRTASLHIYDKRLRNSPSGHNGNDSDSEDTTYGLNSSRTKSPTPSLRGTRDPVPSVTSKSPFLSPSSPRLSAPRRPPLPRSNALLSPPIIQISSAGTQSNSTIVLDPFNSSEFKASLRPIGLPETPISPLELDFTSKMDLSTDARGSSLSSSLTSPGTTATAITTKSLMHYPRNQVGTEHCTRYVPEAEPTDMAIPRVQVTPAEVASTATSSSTSFSPEKPITVSDVLLYSVASTTVALI